MKQRRLSSTVLPNIEVLENTQGFASLREEWEDLHRNTPLATPFQSWAWLYSWWEAYGEDYELRLVTIRYESLLVGIIPLAIERRWGFFGKLLFIGSDITDYLDMLAREGWEAQVSKAGKQALEQLTDWHVADLQQLRPEALAWSLFREWTGPRIPIWQENCVIIEAKPWDELLTNVSRNLRSTARRALRRAEADGLRCEPASVDGTEKAARRLVALHRGLLHGRRITPKVLTRRFESHMVAASQRMTAQGLGEIAEFQRDGEVVISILWLYGRNSTGFYTIGATREASKRYQFSSLLIWNGLNIAYKRNSKHVDLMHGDDAYKLRWNPTITPNHRTILGRNPLLWGPYVGYHMLRSRVKRHALSDDAPQWIKSALRRVRRFTQHLASALVLSGISSDELLHRALALDPGLYL